MSAKDFKQHMLNELRELERLIRNDCAQDNGEFDSYEPEELKWFYKLHEMQELCDGKKADVSAESSINYDGLLAPVIPEKEDMESECETYIDSVCDETDYNDAKTHLRYAFKAGFNYLLNKFNGR